jgi:hypothetical protein
MITRRHQYARRRGARTIGSHRRRCVCHRSSSQSVPFPGSASLHASPPACWRQFRTRRQPLNRASGKRIQRRSDVKTLCCVAAIISAGTGPQTSTSLSCFPPAVPSPINSFLPPSLHGVPTARVPPLLRYYGAMRLLAARLAALRFLRTAMPRLVRCFALGPREPGSRARSWSPGVSRRDWGRGCARSHRFPFTFPYMFIRLSQVSTCREACLGGAGGFALRAPNPRPLRFLGPLVVHNHRFTDARSGGAEVIVLWCVS